MTNKRIYNIPSNSLATMSTVGNFQNVNIFLLLSIICTDIMHDASTISYVKQTI